MMQKVSSPSQHHLNIAFTCTLHSLETLNPFLAEAPRNFSAVRTQCLSSASSLALPDHLISGHIPQHGKSDESIAARLSVDPQSEPETSTKRAQLE